MTDEIGPDIERLLSGLDMDQWRDATFEYFARTPQPNALFNVLAGPWMSDVVAQVRAPDLFRHTVGLVEEWDAANPAEEPRHKGTPYYWLGMAYTVLGDIDLGFLYMHLALAEDRRTSGERAPRMPAFAFVSLDSQDPNQAFKQAIDAFADFLEDRLQRYRQNTGGSLTLPVMRSKVIAVEDRWDAMFHLVYATARIRRLELMGDIVTRTEFGRNLVGQAIGDLCIVADEWLQQGWPGPGEFYPHAVRFLRARGIADAQVVMDAVASAAKQDWGGTVVGLLDGTYGAPTRSLTPVELDVATARLMRNSASHKVTADALLGARFADIEQRTYGAIFAIVEALP